MTASRIDALARQLVNEGVLDNETDARLAALHILVAADRCEAPLPPTERSEMAE